MKRMVRAFVLIGLFALFTAPLFAAESSSVSVTVTPRKVSVTVSPSSVGYGIVAVDATDVTPTGDPAITATNDGNDTETLKIIGANAVTSPSGPYDWVLVTGLPLGDEYNHIALKGPGYTTRITMTTSLQTLASVGAGLTTTFKLRMNTPSWTLDYGQRSTSVTVMATNP